MDVRIALPEEPLSRREREVLQLIAEGGTTKRIAGQLSISPKTVESHVMRVKKKLHTRETAGLVRYALENGLARVR
jgi:DNA-binding CsgD family transcriptional regulator